MRILPVLDLLDGRVVRGVAGKREDYRPVESVLTKSSEPLAVAEAIRSHFGLTELYLADLDAILHQRPNLAVLASLEAAGFTTLVDAGIRLCEDAAVIFGAGVQRVVAGLETLAGPEELARLIASWGAPRVVFSLDLRDGAPLGDRRRWQEQGAFEIACRICGAGCTQLIVLDLVQVGTARGVSTLGLCGEIRRAFPHVEIITGGGVRNADDLKRLADSPVDAVLVASALHNGSIGRADLL